MQIFTVRFIDYTTYPKAKANGAYEATGPQSAAGNFAADLENRNLIEPGYRLALMFSDEPGTKGEYAVVPVDGNTDDVLAEIIVEPLVLNQITSVSEHPA